MLSSIEGANKINLPGGEFYNTDIYVKPFTVLQVKLLNNVVVSNDPVQLINLVGDCINFDIKELYQDDFWYLLHWLRINSYLNFPHVINWECPNCKKRNSSPLSNEALTYKEIPEDYKNNCMKLVFDNFPEGLYIRPQKVRDDIVCQGFIKKKLIKQDDIARTSIIMDLLMLTDPKNNLNIEQLYNMFLENKFTNDDFAAIQFFRKEYRWGVTDKAKFKCSDCLEEVDVEYSFSLMSFLSNDNNRTNFRKRILVSVPAAPADNVSK